jgi:type IV pilus assembly protein PilM
MNSLQKIGNIMALSALVGGSRTKRDQIVAVDLGSRTTKAVYLQRRGGDVVLSRFALADAPIFEKTLSPEMLAEHLRTVSKNLDAKSRQVALTTGVADTVVRHAELPRIPLDDMRMMLKHGARNYLQQDLPNHVFDCHFLSNPAGAAPENGKASTLAKQKVLVVAGRQQLVDDYQFGAKAAGLSAEFIVPGMVAPVNAFELAEPEAFAQSVIALVDVGFRHSSICILNQGELVLSRVVNFGGDRLTTAVAEGMNISYSEAEGIKLGMPQEVQGALDSVLIPLGRELRASIDFFEHQQDRPVSAVFLGGGSTLSDFVVHALQTELMIETRTWNPVHALKLELPPEQVAEIEQVAPQLAVAIGAGLAAL